MKILGPYYWREHFKFLTTKSKTSRAIKCENIYVFCSTMHTVYMLAFMHGCTKYLYDIYVHVRIHVHE